LLSLGSTFLVPSGPGEQLHLHVVCIGPQAVPDMRLLVPFSSIKEKTFFDTACVIEAGEHEFIVKRSFVAYRHAQQRSAAKVLDCLAKGVFAPKPDLRRDVFARVIEGFRLSDFAAPWALKMLTSAT
jgi:hypothetical protein